MINRDVSGVGFRGHEITSKWEIPEVVSCLAGLLLRKFEKFTIR